jgi:hypothetical protein
LRRELWRYHQQRRFQHQFNVMAARTRPAAPQVAPFVPYQRWQRVKLPPVKPIGLAAAKHAHRIEKRRRKVDEWQRLRLDQARRRNAARARHGDTENRIMVKTGKAIAPMSRAELFRWHKENGTLQEFYQLFPK